VLRVSGKFESNVTQGMRIFKQKKSVGGLGMVLLLFASQSGVKGIWSAPHVVECSGDDVYTSMLVMYTLGGRTRWNGS